MDNMNIENIKGKKVLVVGLGKSGIAAAKALLSLGAMVSVQDSKKREDIDGQLLNYLDSRKIKCFFGCLPGLEADFDMMILSPGVNPELEFVREAEARGTEIVGELEIAYRLGRGTFVAITGTNGKTTTTTLVGEIFNKAKKKTHVVGNIGVAVISEALETTEEDWLITETSSFQLQTTKYFKPFVSAIVNLTPDHLNRHHTMEEYGESKAKIWQNQDGRGYLVLNADDEVLNKLCLENIRKKPEAKIIPFSGKKELSLGAFLKGDMLTIKNENGEEISLCSKDELKILGKHNIENALAAAAICYFSGIEAEVIKAGLLDFNGVEHRIEYAGEIDGIKFYNDSKGTNVDAAIVAINAIEKDILLIAGGDGKGQDFSPLIKNFKGKVKKLILLGRDKNILKDCAEAEGFMDFVLCKDMDECVKVAYELAEKGDNVLLSPACASWDMYENFEQRGRHFKDCVNRLGM